MKTVRIQVLDNKKQIGLHSVEVSEGEVRPLLDKVEDVMASHFGFDPTQETLEVVDAIPIEEPTQSPEEADEEEN